MVRVKKGGKNAATGQQRRGVKAAGNSNNNNSNNIDSNNNNNNHHKKKSSGRKKKGPKYVSALLKKQAKRQETLALHKLTQAFAAKVEVVETNHHHPNHPNHNTTPSTTITTATNSSATEFAQEQANLLERLQHNAQTRMMKRLPGRLRKHTKNSQYLTTTITPLQFAPPSFSLTKSTRQLLEETVQGLGGFGLVPQQSSSSQNTPNNNNNMSHHQWSFWGGGSSTSSGVVWPTNLPVPRPPPNTPVCRKNPFSRLKDEDSSEDEENGTRNHHHQKTTNSSLTFQPARFEIMDPDL